MIVLWALKHILCHCFLGLALSTKNDPRIMGEWVWLYTVFTSSIKRSISCVSLMVGDILTVTLQEISMPPWTSVVIVCSELTLKQLKSELLSLVEIVVCLKAHMEDDQQFHHLLCSFCYIKYIEGVISFTRENKIFLNFRGPIFSVAVKPTNRRVKCSSQHI